MEERAAPLAPPEIAGPPAARACACCGREAFALRCRGCGAALSAGGFAVEGLIAQSVHGRVYRARAADGRPVALKELVFALAPDAQAIDAFEREAALLADVDHPAVPKLLAAFREGAGAQLRLYLAQELAEGESLQDRIARRRLDEREARQLAQQALVVLHALHSREPRLLHRDLKPANFIVRPDGQLMLVDFGSARATERGATHGATVVGTFGYAPVEQLGGTADERSDLYALGATLIHAVTGLPPAEILTPSMRIDFARHANVSPQFARFLASLTAPSRLERPASAKQALALLRDERPRQDAPFALAIDEGWKLRALERVGKAALLVLAALATLALLDFAFKQPYGGGFYSCILSEVSSWTDAPAVRSNAPKRVAMNAAPLYGPAHSTFVHACPVRPIPAPTWPKMQKAVASR